MKTLNVVARKMSKLKENSSNYSVARLVGTETSHLDRNITKSTNSVTKPFESTVGHRIENYNLPMNLPSKMIQPIQQGWCYRDTIQYVLSLLI